MAWIGDGNNMANSWLEACALLGFELAVACPEGYDPDAGLLARCAGKARLVRSPAEAVAGAHVLNTDVWASMGQEAEQAKRLRDFAGFIVDDALVARAPARRRWSSTACRPTAARRSARRCSRGRARRCGTRPRTGSTGRRRCWSSSCRTAEGAPRPRARAAPVVHPSTTSPPKSRPRRPPIR